MAITLNFLDCMRVYLQIQNNLCDLQQNIRANATTWKAMAQAQSPDFNTLKQFMTDAFASYATRISWVTALRADPTERQHLLDILAKLQIPEQDVIDKMTDLNTAITQMQGATINSYANVASVCNQILNNVDARFNLWPE